MNSRGRKNSCSQPCLCRANSASFFFLWVSAARPAPRDCDSTAARLGREFLSKDVQSRPEGAGVSAPQCPPTADAGFLLRECGAVGAAGRNKKLKKKLAAALNVDPQEQETDSEGSTSGDEEGTPEKGEESGEGQTRAASAARVDEVVYNQPSEAEGAEGAVAELAASFEEVFAKFKLQQSQEQQVGCHALSAERPSPQCSAKVPWPNTYKCTLPPIHTVTPQIPKYTCIHPQPDRHTRLSSETKLCFRKWRRRSKKNPRNRVASRKEKAAKTKTGQKRRLRVKRRGRRFRRSAS